MVHTFSALGRNLAVDVNSGAVHVLDRLCCDLLSLWWRAPWEMPVPRI